MVTFTADTDGTPPAVWTTALDAAGLTPFPLDALTRLVVVAAHPDDETLGAAGLLASATTAGVDIDVVVACDGEASHPHSPTHTPAQLAAIRRGEVAAALAVVAPGATMTLLHLPDGGLTDRLAPMTEAIALVLARGGSGPVVVVSPWIGDGHPDHHAAGTAASDAARTHPGATVLQYPIWAWHWGTPDAGDVPLHRLRALRLTAAVAEAKGRALAAHHSQVTPLSEAPGDEMLLPRTLTAFFEAGTEYFLTPAAADTRPPPTAFPGVPDPSAFPVGSSAAADGSLGRGFFDDFYGDRTDPWEFETRWYEERKRDLTLASLPRRRFRSAFEPGCSIGVLTAGLAARSDRLLAADIARRPLDLARRRLRDATHVAFEQLQVPRDWPAGPFDLVVLSEVGYYCDSDDLDRLIDRAVASLTDDGVLVACHWRHPVAEYPLRGDDVHDRLRERSGLDVLATHVEADFRLDVLVRPPAVSVAAADGLLG
ncbi:bifunctional PIG-L family deacetylase/class I SAM-dependent methyltransferase [Nakamurella deserti]|uniref:bifunctional PIG-L family deacetylase/class I SAM-dependent methyltransferase n=1 Tax=Nakamurella deserti TaxID=2164074 RepID=UPI000DBE9372|nr:bifunctional PIG-L family deacetylase/class I SAM-dependent methyltransferase [Nakamurella deserti]